MFNQFKCRVAGAVDADTLRLDLNLGLGVGRFSEDVRLLGVDTHEIHGVKHGSEEYEKGMEEWEFVRVWLDEQNDGSSWPLTVTIPNGEEGKFGRPLGIVVPSIHDGWDESLNKAIIDEYGDEVRYE